LTAEDRGQRAEGRGRIEIEGRGCAGEGRGPDGGRGRRRFKWKIIKFYFFPEMAKHL
jgi:hypothetical protein